MKSPEEPNPTIIFDWKNGRHLRVNQDDGGQITLTPLNLAQAEAITEKVLATKASDDPKKP